MTHDEQFLGVHRGTYNGWSTYIQMYVHCDVYSNVHTLSDVHSWSEIYWVKYIRGRSFNDTLQRIIFQVFGTSGCSLYFLIQHSLVGLPVSVNIDYKIVTIWEITEIKNRSFSLKDKWSHLLGTGCGWIGRAVASNNRRLRFKSSHQQNVLMNIITVNCRKEKNNQKEAEHCPLWNPYHFLFKSPNFKCRHVKSCVQRNQKCTILTPRSLCFFHPFAPTQIKRRSYVRPFVHVR